MYRPSLRLSRNDGPHVERQQQREIRGGGLLKTAFRMEERLEHHGEEEEVLLIKLTIGLH